MADIKIGTRFSTEASELLNYGMATVVGIKTYKETDKTDFLASYDKYPETKLVFSRKEIEANLKEC